MMNQVRFIAFFLLCTAFASKAQSFQHFFTGDTSDVTTRTAGGVVLMGGATENDAAMRWFLQQSGGGDIVVLRASGGDGYNQYLFTELGILVNSVETILTTSRQAALEAYVARQIRNAEGLWIAGGDQSNYLNFWKDGPVAEAIQYLISVKKAPVGGTSAGMAILGQAYFAAYHETILSEEALKNPYDKNATIGYNDFIHYPDLQTVITDTHYDHPDRKGRHVSFMARLIQDFQIVPKGIACEEYTAVCIDSAGWARVYGNYPEKQDFAYFIQVNDEFAGNKPQVCVAKKPLEWSQNHAVLKVWKAPGSPDGSTRFNMRDWSTTQGTAGFWENWWVENGVLHQAPRPLIEPVLIKKP
jgi:cyanophycinase-like exopeptidase